MRSTIEKYPDYSAEIEYLRNNPVTVEIVQKIIKKHAKNRAYNLELHERYEALKEAVPIFERKVRFEEEENPINNQINHDFFGEIVDFKTGYFAGTPFSYGYSSTDEAEEVTGGEEAVDEATKTVTDFATRNNMFDKDMDATKNAAICGYSGRLFYIDKEGNERVLIVPGHDTIILSETDITEPEFGIRYFCTLDIDDNKIWRVEFYDDQNIYYFDGQLSVLTFIKSAPHLFDYCPLQGIPNNGELQGDAEKVLAGIDEYDKTVSDNANDIENFANAYMVFENVNIVDEEIRNAQKSGAFKFYSGPNATGKVYYLTKDIQDGFIEHHLDRLEDNIYRFSKTPNLNDETFGSASGISLKFKLTALESKCGMFEAKMRSAAQYMFKLLASSWAKRRIIVDPLQCIVEFKRNFPLDIVSEAQAAQALINAGLPKEIAFDKALSFVDDIDYVMALIEEEKDNIPPLTEIIPEDDINGNEENFREVSEGAQEDRGTQGA